MARREGREVRSGFQYEHCTDQWRATAAQRLNYVVHIMSGRRCEVLQSVGTNKCTRCKGQGKGKGPEGGVEV